MNIISGLVFSRSVLVPGFQGWRLTALSLSALSGDARFCPTSVRVSGRRSVRQQCTLWLEKDASGSEKTPHAPDLTFIVLLRTKSCTMLVIASLWPASSPTWSCKVDFYFPRLAYQRPAWRVERRVVGALVIPTEGRGRRSSCFVVSGVLSRAFC